MSTRSSNESQKLDYMTWYQGSSNSNAQHSAYTIPTYKISKAFSLYASTYALVKIGRVVDEDSVVSLTGSAKQ